MAWKVELTVQEAHLIGYALDKIGPFVLDTNSIEECEPNEAEIKNTAACKRELNNLRDSVIEKLKKEYCWEKDITELQVSHKGDYGFLISEIER